MQYCNLPELKPLYSNFCFTPVYALVKKPLKLDTISFVLVFHQRYQDYFLGRRKRGELLYFLWKPSTAFRHFVQLIFTFFSSSLLQSGGQQEHLCVLLISELDISVPSCSSWREEIIFYSFVCCRSYSIKVSEINCAEGNELKLIQCQEMHQLLNQAVGLLFWAVQG